MISNLRYELKYVLNYKDENDAKNWMYHRTNVVSKFVPRYVNSLYFDDISFTSVRDNLAGVSDREKFRLRWYNNFENPSPVIEKKMRKGRLGYKKSLKFDIFKDKLFISSPMEIANSVFDFLVKKQCLSCDFKLPVLYVQYLREYYEGKDGLRITFDKDIKFGLVNGDKLIPNISTISNNKMIMEIKFDPLIKNNVTSLLRNLNKSPTRNSKYLLGLASFGQVFYV